MPVINMPVDAKPAPTMPTEKTKRKPVATPPPAAGPRANRTVLIRKSNDLVEGRYKFDIWETRIFLKMLTLIKSDDKGFHEYKIYIKDIIDTFGVDSKDGYRLIKEGAVKLMGKTIQTKIRVEAGWEDFVAPIVAGFKGRSEVDEPSYIKLSFHPDMRPLLLELRERFLVYDFQNVRNLSSPYYIRIYELLKQYERIGERRFEVDELRGILGLQEEYKLYGHFKSRILEPTRQRLLEYTDISFTYTEVKQGRAVTSLVFHIRQNRPQKQPSPRRALPAPAPSVPELFDPPPTLHEPVVALAQTPPQGEVFDQYFTRLNDWWGVQAAEFAKKSEGKTAEEVERAIEFTKDRIRSGKAENPAGVFLDALAKGHKTHKQHRADKQAALAEQQKRLAALVADYQKMVDDYHTGVNDMVRAITTVHPEVTEEVIAEIKGTYRLTGDQRVENLSVEDFRKDPMLRSMVIAGIIRRYPARFEEINAQFSPTMEKIKHEIRQLRPDFVF
ncbi:MAG: replication initiation protein [Saprospiraceae bacterium]